MNSETTIPYSNREALNSTRLQGDTDICHPDAFGGPAKTGTHPIVPTSTPLVAFPGDSISSSTYEYIFCRCNFLTWKFCLVFELYHLETSPCNSKQIKITACGLKLFKPIQAHFEKGHLVAILSRKLRGKQKLSFVAAYFQEKENKNTRHYILLTKGQQF